MKVGVDIGGSHIAIGLVENGLIVEKIEKSWTNKERENIKESIINYIVKTIKELSNKYDIESIGIGIPGTQANGIIVQSGKLKMDNFPIVKKLQEKINYNIKIRNDAKCAAIAEDKYGSLKNYNRSLFITLGTGVGGAILINHQLLDAGDNPRCEVGHMIIEKDGLQCTCGNKGCWQQYSSMKVLKNNLRKEWGLTEKVHGEELLEMLHSGKQQNSVQEFIEYLSIVISNLINIFEPEVISIGGSFVYFEDILLEKLKQNIIEKQLLFNPRETLNICSAVLGNDAGIIGATLI